MTEELRYYIAFNGGLVVVRGRGFGLHRL